MSRKESLTREEFYQELVERFFTNNSYFMHCLNDELEKYISEHEPPKDSSLLFGNLIDHLIDSESVRDELDYFQTIAAFSSFITDLEEGITFLKENKVAPDEMKNKIADLAKSFVMDAFQSFSRDTVGKSLREHLDQNENHDVPDFEKSRKDDNPESNETAELPGEELIFDAPLGKDESETEMNFSDESTSREEPFLTIDEDLEFEDTGDEGLERKDTGDDGLEFKDTRELHDDSDFEIEQEGLEEHEKISLDEFEQVLLEPSTLDTNENDITETPDILPKADEDETLNEFDEIDFDLQSLPEASSQNDESENDERHVVTGEPESVQPAFKGEVADKLSQLRNELSQVKNNDKDIDSWDRFKKLFEEVASTSMIYGFEAFEDIATKTARFLNDTTALQDDLILKKLEEACQLLDKILTGNLDHVDSSEIKSFSKGLNKSENNHLPEVQGKEKESEQDELKKKPVVEHVADLVSDVIPEQSSALDPEQIKLPGEDDDEIKDLIHEISRENTEVAQEPKEENNTEIATENDNIVEEELKEFFENAELYVSVIDGALINLEIQPNDKSSLEDLELASNSLKDLALKMAHEELHELPLKISQLALSTVETNFSLSEIDIQLIKETFELFKNFKKVDDINSEAFQEKVSLIQVLRDSIENGLNFRHEHTIENTDEPESVLR